MALIIGFESLEPRNLERMSKQGNQVEEYVQVIRLLRQAGIFVYGQFIFGYPHDGAETFAKSLAFAQREKLFLSSFNPWFPIRERRFTKKSKPADDCTFRNGG